METIELSLDAPASIHLRELANSTSHLYNLLRPWCFSEQTNLPIFKPILSYVHAIDVSITAAQKGRSLCEGLIAFLELFESSDEMQRQQYHQGLARLAQEAEDNAEKAKAKFRSVRIIVNRLVQDAQRQKTTNTFEPTSSNEQQVKELEQGVSVLERFSTYINTCISWWTIMLMNHKSQAFRQQTVIDSYNPIRSQDILKTWKKLCQGHVIYIDKIQLIQDANPDFKLLLNQARLEDLIPSSVPKKAKKGGSKRALKPAKPLQFKPNLAPGAEAGVESHWGEMLSPWYDAPKQKSTALPEQAAALEDTRKRVAQSVVSVMGTAADIGHEALYVGVEFLDLVPVPGLQTVAKKLLNIWDAIQDLDIITLECLRLIDRCAVILLSIRGIVHRAGNKIEFEISISLATLQECFDRICRFIIKQSTQSWTQRYLKRDEISPNVTNGFKMHSRYSAYPCNFAS